MPSGKKPSESATKWLEHETRGTGGLALLILSVGGQPYGIRSER
jgi:hypothetical protein